MGSLAQERAIPRGDIFRNDVPVWQGKHLITKHAFSSSSYTLLSSLSKPPVAISFLSPGWYISPNCPTCPGVSYLYGAPVRIKLNFSPVHLSYVNLTIRPAKETQKVERKLFSLYNKLLIILYSYWCYSEMIRLQSFNSYPSLMACWN